MTEFMPLIPKLTDAHESDWVPVCLWQLGRMLLECGCDVNYLSGTGESALHILTKKGRFEAAMVLLTHGANANLKGQEGNTALHLAMKVCVHSVWTVMFTKNKKPKTLVLKEKYW